MRNIDFSNPKNQRHSENCSNLCLMQESKDIYGEIGMGILAKWNYLTNIFEQVPVSQAICGIRNSTYSGIGSLTRHQFPDGRHYGADRMLRHEVLHISLDPEVKELGGDELGRMVRIESDFALLFEFKLRILSEGRMQPKYQSILQTRYCCAESDKYDIGRSVPDEQYFDVKSYCYALPAYKLIGTYSAFIDQHKDKRKIRGDFGKIKVLNLECSLTDMCEEFT